MRLNHILKYIGMVLVLMAVFVFISAIVAAEDGPDSSFLPLLLSGTLIGVLGAFPMIFVHTATTLSRMESYVVVVGAWITACLTGALPYLMYGGEFTVLNALFESISGFTTTGASILNDIEDLPQGLLFWRMSTAWIGGIGIVLMFSMLIPSGSQDGSMLQGVEVSDIARSGNGLKSRSLGQIMAITYIALTILTTLGLRIGGMRWFDALTHAMSCCSTCGFSTKNESIAAFGNPFNEYVIVISVILSSMRFTLLYKTVMTRKKKCGKMSEVTKSFLASIIIGTVLTTVSLDASHTYDSMGECFRMSLFQVSSLATTTGFATADSNTWPQMAILVLLMCSFVCGCSGSTSGGMKMDRMVLAFQALRMKVLHIMNPNAVVTAKIDGKAIREDMENDAVLYIFFYLGITAIGAFLNVLGGLDIKTGVTAAIACIGNVGPGFGGVGSMCNYASIPAFTKIVSMLLMLLGRLEIYPILAIFTRKALNLKLY